jgi:hypothetical protein
LEKTDTGSDSRAYGLGDVRGKGHKVTGGLKKGNGEVCLIELVFSGPTLEMKIAPEGE